MNRQKLFPEWDSVKDKKLGELSAEEKKKLALYMENTELANLLLTDEAVQGMFRKSPQLEVDLIKSPISNFSKSIKKAKKLEGYQKKEFIIAWINIYNRLLTRKCLTAEAEYIRVQQIPSVKNCIADFEALLDALPTHPNAIGHQKQVLKDSQNTNNINAGRPTIAAYAILHVYLSMFNGPAVSQQNKNEMAKKYGYSSGDQLRNDFTRFQNEDKRRELNTESKRSADTHLERYRMILPLLEKENPKAFEVAKKDFEYLQKVYKKYH